MRRPLALVTVGLLALAAQAVASPAVRSGNERLGALPQAATTCTSTPLARVRSGVDACVTGLTVLSVHDTQVPDGAKDFRRDSTTVVSDGRTRRTAHLADLWWQNGAMTAGQQITLWARPDRAGVLQVQRWTETQHTGRAVRLADIGRGLVPENTYVWTTGVLYLPFTQEVAGDGDTHLMMASPCGPAGIVAETTPALRGFVSRPLAGVVPAVGSVKGTQDDPPAEMPVTVYGPVRFDYGHGYWEVHPVRAWHLATAQELATQPGDCAQEKARFDAATGLPYGVPACGTDAPGEVACAPRCYVSSSEVGRRPVVRGRCDEDLQPHGPVTTQQANAARLVAGAAGRPE